MKIAQIDVIPIRAPRKEVVRAGTGADPSPIPNSASSAF